MNSLTDEEDSMNDTTENGNYGVKQSDSENSNMSIGKQVYVDKEKKNDKPPKKLGNIHDEDVDSSTLSQETSSSKSRFYSEGAGKIFHQHSNERNISLDFCFL